MNTGELNFEIETIVETPVAMIAHITLEAFHVDSDNIEWLIASQTFHFDSIGENYSRYDQFIGEFRSWYNDLALTGFVDGLVKFSYFILAMPIAAPPVFRMFVSTIFGIFVSIIVWLF